MKIGSSAPTIFAVEHMKMLLKLDIYNKNSEILLHNWNKEEEN